MAMLTFNIYALYSLLLKVARTISVKIVGSTKADHNLIVWLGGINWLSKRVFKSKELNSNRLHCEYYARLRKMGLPSQMACSASRFVTATYASQVSNKRWSMAVFKNFVIPICHGREFRLTQRGLRLWGELLTIPCSTTLPHGKWKDSKLKRVNGQWYLLLCYEIDIPEPKTEGSIVGCDMGVKRLLVATNSSNNKSFFFKGGHLNHRRSCIRKARSAIQAVGSRSSRRLLQRMKRHEAAVTEHVCHVASKALVAYAVQNNARKIVLEDLSNVRDASLKKGKDLRSEVHRWPYANVRFKIGYKAQAVGIALELVSSRNTSRGCPRCGDVSKANRNGLDFLCKKCGHHDDADRNASVNIRNRSLSIALNAAEMGSFSSPQKLGTA